MELLIPVDPEQAVIDELDARYPFPVGTSIPADKPPTFIRVLAAGGTQRDLVTDSPLVTVEVFSTRESRASNTANEALAVLLAAAQFGRMGDEVCYKVETASLPQNYSLPSVPTHARYLFTIAPALRRRVTTL